MIAERIVSLLLDEGRYGFTVTPSPGLNDTAKGMWAYKSYNVIDRETRQVVAHDLHYLDAIELKRKLEAGEGPEEKSITARTIGDYGGHFEHPSIARRRDAAHIYRP